MTRCTALSILALVVCLLPTVAVRAGESMQHEKFVLDNGLTVILHEDHRLPLVVVDVWYHVGSREEPADRAGFAHLFEHLMFMGTARVPNGGFDEILESGGAWSNASTDFDRTDYYEVGPSRLLPTMLWLEADRMEALGAAMTQQKLDLQRDVVHNEIRESYDNAPYGPSELRIYEELFPPGHPYHFNVIGKHEHIARASVEDVKAFFATYYVPNNATLVVAGDFDPTATKRLVADLFGTLPRADDPPRRPPLPAGFETERRIVLPDDVKLPRTILAWHTPAFFATGDAEMDLLAAVLTETKNGRLQRRLVHEERTAVSVSAWQESMRLGSIFRLQVTAVPGVPLERIEQAIDEELAKLRAEGPTEAELDRVRASFETDAISGLQSLLSVADRLQMYDAYLGEPDRLRWDLDRYRQAGTDAVRDAVRRWITPDKRLVLRVVPREKALDTAARDKRPADAAVRGFTPPVPDVFRLENGLEVWRIHRPDVPLVSARLVFPAGSSTDTPATSGRALFAASMIREGAGELDALAFAEALDGLGAVFFVEVDRDDAIVGLQTLHRHLDRAFGLFATAVRKPLIDQGGWSRVRGRLATALDTLVDEPERLALRVARTAFFQPRGERYALPVTGTRPGIVDLSRDDLRAFHDARYRPAGAVLMLAGDLSLQEARTLAERHLGTWQGQVAAAPEPSPASVGSKARTLLVDRPGAEQTVIHLVLPGVAWTDPARVPLGVANEALGGSFTSRLNARLREREGYTYGCYSWLLPYRHDGLLEASAAVQTEVTGKALRSLLEEVGEALGGQLTEAELARAVATLESSTVQSFEDLAGMLAAFLPYATSGGAPGDLLADAQKLAQVDVAAARAAMQARPGLDHAVLVLVGDAKRIAPQLEGLAVPEPVRLTQAEALTFGLAR